MLRLGIDIGTGGCETKQAQAPVSVSDPFALINIVNVTVDSCVDELIMSQDGVEKTIPYWVIVNLLRINQLSMSTHQYTTSHAVEDMSM